MVGNPSSLERFLFLSCTIGLIPRLYHYLFPESLRNIISAGANSLQGITEELVHLGNTGRDGEIDCSVTDVDNETTEDIWVDLVSNLELLALSNVRGLGNGRFETRQGLVIERGSAGNGHFNLTASSTHELAKLLTDTLQERKSVVLGKCVEEVLDSVRPLTSVLLELSNDGRLVLSGKSWSSHDGGELSILMVDFVEGLEGLGGGVEGRALDGGSVQSAGIGAIESVESDWGLRVGSSRSSV